MSQTSGDIVQYSLEGYVESHWVPLQVTVLDPRDNISVLAANVTGVSGVDLAGSRFPMLPVHGLHYRCAPSESIYSNNVAMKKMLPLSGLTITLVGFFLAWCLRISSLSLRRST